MERKKLSGIDPRKDLPYWIAFSFFEGIGPLRFKALLEYFGSAQSAWEASEKKLGEVGLGKSLIERFVIFRRLFPLEKIKIEFGDIAYLTTIVGDLAIFGKGVVDKERRRQLGWVKRMGERGGYRKAKGGVIGILTWIDELYPESLRQIEASPPVIYLKSAAFNEAEAEEKQVVDILRSAWEKPTIAVVGTRKITSYGRSVTERLVEELAQAGVVVVSGMAKGVDGVAHRTALKYKGETIAVLGSGVDVVYPAENRDIYERLTKPRQSLSSRTPAAGFSLSRKSGSGRLEEAPVQNEFGNRKSGLTAPPRLLEEAGNDSGIGHFPGLVISEFPPGTPPLPGNFPARNRIIAGLSDAVLVTEAAEDSGSLITARLAAEQGKEVFAVPGPITSSLSQGTSFLIKQGAKLVSSVEDILEEMKIEGLKLQGAKFRAGRRLDIEKEMGEEEERIWQCLEEGEKHIDDIIRQTGLEAGRAGSILSMMALKGWVKEVGGGKWGRG